MINIKMQPTEVSQTSPRIAVIGVGGAGGNAVNNMIASNLEGCEFLVCNTDAQALSTSLSENKVQLGVNVTGGLGAGSKPEIGQAAAEESLEDVLRYLDGANMAFVTCGMGGGTGTGAAPVIAKACRQQGILTVGVVTKPFHFEGAHRMEQAERGIEEMQQYVDTLIVIPNQNLFRIANEKTTFAEAFKMADTVLQSGVRGVTDLMVRPGIVNLDFADIRTAMLQMGKAMMGTGEATGDKRAIEAAEAAINNPLLDDVSMKGANGVIINVTGGYDMTLFEADEACNRIRDEVDPNANIIFGATFDDSMDGFMRVSIVATGIDNEVSKGKIFGGSSGDGGGQRKPMTVDRSVPNTAPLVADPVPVSAAASLGGNAQARPAASLSGREVIKGLTAPMPISETLRSSDARSLPGTPVVDTVASSAAPAEFGAVSLDMFEQSEFSNAQGEVMSAPPRGHMHNDAFIPPKPLEPDASIPENGIGSHISSFHGAHVEGKVSGGGAVPVSGLQLNPPKAITPPPQAKPQRTPSLLERITGTVQQHISHLRDDNSVVETSLPPTDDGVKQAVTVPSVPAQGSLNISTPSGKPAVTLDDELDIPAFLRRQAN
ncbi:MAG: cell division protein FtsZ [Zetaproteobacteria bacterium]|nr:MAG: cell division protein FtsZ [Zetaproteobacteria bacterium]